ncbi:MAG: sodium:solute symporter family protein [Methanosarcinaceae archaeon]|nr:sodium:solute symporter family protein [Methanosarcinaceae archaeon]
MDKIYYYMFIILLAVYIAVLLSIGYYFSKKQKSVTDFWLGGRKIGPLPIGFSAAASWITGGGILSVIAYYLVDGMGSIWTFAAPNVIALIVIGLLVKKIKSLPSITQPELLEQRYSSIIRAPVAILIMIIMMLFAAADISGLSLIFNVFFGLEPIYAALLIALAVSAYVLLGGLSAVIWTDVLQFILLASVVIFGAIATLGFATGMFGNVENTISLTGLFTESVPSSWWNPLSMGIPLALIFMVAIMPGFISENDQWQKVWAARDERSGRNGFFFGAFLMFLIFGLFCFIAGISLRYLYPEAITDFSLAEASLLKFFMSSFSPIVVIFTALGLTAAAMSCTDTFATSGGSCISRDIYQRYIKPDATMNDMKRVNRISVLIIIIGATVLSFLPINILGFVHIATYIATAAYFFPLMGGLYWKRATKEGATVSILIGGVVQILLCAYDVYLVGSGESMATLANAAYGPNVALLFECHGVLIGMTLGLVSFIGISLITPKPSNITLAPFFKEEADMLTVSETKKIDENSDMYKKYKQYANVDPSGDRTQIQLEIKSSENIDWFKFSDDLRKSHENVWISPTGKDSIYRLTHNDMLACPRITRGKDESEIWVAAEPTTDDENTMYKEVFIAYTEIIDSLEKLGYKHNLKTVGQI